MFVIAITGWGRGPCRLCWPCPVSPPRSGSDLIQEGNTGRKSTDMSSFLIIRWLEVRGLIVNAEVATVLVRSQHPPTQWNLRGGRCSSWIKCWKKSLLKIFLAWVRCRKRWEGRNEVPFTLPPQISGYTLPLWFALTCCMTTFPLILFLSYLPYA